MDPKKVANNILDFLLDPTKIPVKDRLYFRPEEILKNESYDSAKADAAVAYKEQKHNSDFYPSKNRSTQREAMLMDRKSLIASFDILSKNFREDHPIATDLRTMAAALVKMEEEEFAAIVNASGPDFDSMESVEAKKMEMIKCPTCDGKVMKQTGYCLHCKKKIKDMKCASEVAETTEVSDFWSKEASDLVAQALVSEVTGMSMKDDEEDDDDDDAATTAAAAEKEVCPKCGKEECVCKVAAEEPAKPVEEPAEKKDEKPAKKEPAKEEPAEKPAEEQAAPAPEAKEAKKAEPEVKPETPVKPEEETNKESKVVDTDILASFTFGDLELTAGIQDVGEMSAAEQEKLSQLFTK